jgi:hypothetical protein
MKLFYLSCLTGDLDLLVRADDEVEAQKLWREYYDHDPSISLCWVGVVPDTPERGAIPWDSIRDYAPALCPSNKV